MAFFPFRISKRSHVRGAPPCAGLIGSLVTSWGLPCAGEVVPFRFVPSCCPIVFCFSTVHKIRKQVYSEIGHFLVGTIIGSCKVKRSIVKCYRFTRLLALLMAML